MINTENKTRLSFRFDLKSFLIFLLLFAIEVIIALYIDDKIIRPYIGDVIVVILMYYFIKSFIRISPLFLSITVLLIAFAVEIGQYFKLVEILGLQNNKIMRVIIGSYFSWGDLIAYTIGALSCYLIDKKKK